MTQQRTYSLWRTIGTILASYIAASTFFLLTACSSQNPVVNPPPTPGTWKIVHSANPGSAQNNLNAIAAISATDVWAVGSFSSQHLGVQGTKALIEHWNGAMWSVVASPHPPLGDGILSGVAALSPTDAWTVGYTFDDSASYVTKTLIEHWNGSDWTVVASPSLMYGAQLTAISALSATNIWAVGYGNNEGQALIEQTLILHWDGKKWSEVQSPNPGSGADELNGLAAISSNDVWAVGDFTNGTDISMSEELFEHWNGTSWTVVQSPNAGVVGNSLSAIAATSTNNVWAVGGSTGSSSLVETLIEHWDGNAWSNVQGQNPGQASNSLSALTILSPHNIWAVGSWSNAFTGPQAQSLIEHWDGNAWSSVASPGIGTNTTMLDGVMFLPHSSRIMAVGTGANDGIPIQETVPPPGSGTFNVTPVTAQTLVEACCF